MTLGPIHIIIILVWLVIIYLVIKIIVERPHRNISEVVGSQVGDEHSPKEGGTMSTSDVSETVLRLIDCGRISWPKSVSDRNKFIVENFGKVWDALLQINIDANVEVFSHVDRNESYDTSTSERASGIAWDALGEVLMLVLILEDALNIDITPSSKYDKPNDFSVKKAKIRSRIRS